MGSEARAQQRRSREPGPPRASPAGEMCGELLPAEGPARTACGTQPGASSATYQPPGSGSPVEQLQLSDCGLQQLRVPERVGEVRVVLAARNQITLLLPWIEHFTQLLTLDLRQNRLHSCAGIGACRRLRDLDVKDNLLADGHALAAALRPCRRLVRLDARFNPFSASFYEEGTVVGSSSLDEGGPVGEVAGQPPSLTRVTWRARAVGGAPRLRILDGLVVDDLERSLCARMPDLARGGAMAMPPSSSSSDGNGEKDHSAAEAHPNRPHSPAYWFRLAVMPGISGRKSADDEVGVTPSKELGSPANCVTSHLHADAVSIRDPSLYLDSEGGAAGTQLALFSTSLPDVHRHSIHTRVQSAAKCQSPPGAMGLGGMMARSWTHGRVVAIRRALRQWADNCTELRFRARWDGSRVERFGFHHLATSRLLSSQNQPRFGTLAMPTTKGSNAGNAADIFDIQPSRNLLSSAPDVPRLALPADTLPSSCEAAICPSFVYMSEPIAECEEAYDLCPRPHEDEKRSDEFAELHRDHAEWKQCECSDEASSIGHENVEAAARGPKSNWQTGCEPVQSAARTLTIAAEEAQAEMRRADVNRDAEGLMAVGKAVALTNDIPLRCAGDCCNCDCYDSSHLGGRAYSNLERMMPSSHEVPQNQSGLLGGDFNGIPLGFGPESVGQQPPSECRWSSESLTAMTPSSVTLDSTQADQQHILRFPLGTRPATPQPQPISTLHGGRRSEAQARSAAGLPKTCTNTGSAFGRADALSLSATSFPLGTRPGSPLSLEPSDPLTLGADAYERRGKLPTFHDRLGSADHHLRPPPLTDRNSGYHYWAAGAPLAPVAAPTPSAPMLLVSPCQHTSGSSSPLSSISSTPQFFGLPISTNPSPVPGLSTAASPSPSPSCASWSPQLGLSFSPCDPRAYPKWIGGGGAASPSQLPLSAPPHLHGSAMDAWSINEPAPMITARVASGSRELIRSRGTIVKSAAVNVIQAAIRAVLVRRRRAKAEARWREATAEVRSLQTPSSSSTPQLHLSGLGFTHTSGSNALVLGPADATGPASSAGDLGPSSAWRPRGGLLRTAGVSDGWGAKCANWVLETVEEGAEVTEVREAVASFREEGVKIERPAKGGKMSPSLDVSKTHCVSCDEAPGVGNDGVATHVGFEIRHSAVAAAEEIEPDQGSNCLGSHDGHAIAQVGHIHDNDDLESNYDYAVAQDSQVRGSGGLGSHNKDAVARVADSAAHHAIATKCTRDTRERAKVEHDVDATQTVGERSRTSIRAGQHATNTVLEKHAQRAKSSATVHSGKRVEADVEVQTQAISVPEVDVVPTKLTEVGTAVGPWSEVGTRCSSSLAIDNIASVPAAASITALDMAMDLVCSSNATLEVVHAMVEASSFGKDVCVDEKQVAVSSFMQLKGIRESPTLVPVAIDAHYEPTVNTEEPLGANDRGPDRSTCFGTKAADSAHASTDQRASHPGAISSSEILSSPRGNTCLGKSAPCSPFAASPSSAFSDQCAAPIRLRQPSLHLTETSVNDLAGRMTILEPLAQPVLPPTPSNNHSGSNTVSARSMASGSVLTPRRPVEASRLRGQVVAVGFPSIDQGAESGTIGTIQVPTTKGPPSLSPSKMDGLAKYETDVARSPLENSPTQESDCLTIEELVSHESSCAACSETAHKFLPVLPGGESSAFAPRAPFEADARVDKNGVMVVGSAVHEGSHAEMAAEPPDSPSTAIVVASSVVGAPTTAAGSASHEPSNTAFCANVTLGYLNTDTGNYPGTMELAARDAASVREAPTPFTPVIGQAQVCNEEQPPSGFALTQIIMVPPDEMYTPPRTKPQPKISSSRRPLAITAARDVASVSREGRAPIRDGPSAHGRSGSSPRSSHKPGQSQPQDRVTTAKAIAPSGHLVLRSSQISAVVQRLHARASRRPMRARKISPDKPLGVPIRPTVRPAPRLSRKRPAAATQSTHCGDVRDANSSRRACATISEVVQLGGPAVEGSMEGRRRGEHRVSYERCTCSGVEVSSVKGTRAYAGQRSRPSKGETEASREASRNCGAEAARAANAPEIRSMQTDHMIWPGSALAPLRLGASVEALPADSLAFRTCRRLLQLQLPPNALRTCGDPVYYNRFTDFSTIGASMHTKSLYSYIPLRVMQLRRHVPPAILQEALNASVAAASRRRCACGGHAKAVAPSRRRSSASDESSDEMTCSGANQESPRLLFGSGSLDSIAHFVREALWPQVQNGPTRDLVFSEELVHVGPPILPSGLASSTVSDVCTDLKDPSLAAKDGVANLGARTNQVGDKGGSLALCIWRTVLAMSWAHPTHRAAHAGHCRIIGDGVSDRMIPLFVIDYVLASDGAQLI